MRQVCDNSRGIVAVGGKFDLYVKVVVVAIVAVEATDQYTLWIDTVIHGAVNLFPR